jgi:hypothetical protein
MDLKTIIQNEKNGQVRLGQKPGDPDDKEAKADYTAGGLPNAQRRSERRIPPATPQRERLPKRYGLLPEA